MAQMQWHDSDLLRLERDLEGLNKRAFPFVWRNSINRTAFHVRDQSLRYVAAHFIQRNAWTRQSLRYDRTRARRVSEMRAFAGSTEAYMRVQEFGGTYRSSGKSGWPIAQPLSAGQGRKQPPRTKTVRKRWKRSNIVLPKIKPTKGSSARRRASMLNQVRRSGQKVFFGTLGTTTGFWRMGGRKTKPEVLLLHDTSKRSVRIPPSPWLTHAVRRASSFQPRIYQKQLMRQNIRARSNLRKVRSSVGSRLP